MRTRISLVLVCLSFLSLYSCKNDVNILAPYKDIAVVYGLLDQNDTAHYIRINKAYEGAGNAYTMATNYDSINYPTDAITVSLQDVDVNGMVVGTYTLTPDSSIPVNPGTFSYPKQVLYKTKRVLNVNDTYNLIVNNNKTGKQTTGSTTLLPDVQLTSSSTWMESKGNFYASPYQASPTRIAWTTSATACIYQANIRFFYFESNSSTGTSGEKYVDWVFAAQTVTSLGSVQPMEDDFTQMSFIQFLAGSLTANPNIHRHGDSAEVSIISGSQDLNTYIQLSLPPLGVNQTVPLYTDVKNGIGIFTARHDQMFSLPTVYPPLMDSVRTNPLTAGLNF